jgi:hypothetical protein
MHVCGSGTTHKFGGGSRKPAKIIIYLFFIRFKELYNKIALIKHFPYILSIKRLAIANEKNKY